MAGSGEFHWRANDKWAVRIKASNGQIVGAGGGQGYGQTRMRATLEEVMRRDCDGPIEEVD